MSKAAAADDDDARHARNAALLTASLSHTHAYAHSIDFGSIAAAIEGLDQPVPPSPFPSKNERLMHVDPNGEFVRSELRDLKARIVKWADVHEAIRDFVKVDLIGYNARQTTQIPGTHDSVTYPNLVNRGLLLLEDNVANGRPTAVTPAIRVLAGVCDKKSVEKRKAFSHVFGVTAGSVISGVTTTLPLDGNGVEARMKLFAAWRKGHEGHAEAAAEALQFERENHDWVKRLPPVWNKHCEAIKLGAGPPGVGNNIIPRFVGDWADTRSRCVHPVGLPECSAVDLTPVPINPAPAVREMYDTVRAIIADQGEGDDLIAALGLSMAAHIGKAFNHIDDAKALIAGTMPHEAAYGLQQQQQQQQK